MTGGRGPVRAVLLDLLMATMDSMSVWATAAGDPSRGLAWRDAVTERMRRARRYVPYDVLVAEAASDVGLRPDASDRLRAAWREMRPWPDAAALGDAAMPYAFVTNCSTELAMVAVGRSGLEPTFTLSAEEAGWYKPAPEIYRMACERLAASPADVAFVAGAPYDARGAHAAGLRSILVRRRPLGEPLPNDVVSVSDLGEALVAIRRGSAREC